MRTISVIGARVEFNDIVTKGWCEPEPNPSGYTGYKIEMPYGLSAFKDEIEGDYVIGYIIYDSLKDISDNEEISVEILFDLIDEFAHETNITEVKYITIQIPEEAI